MTDMTGDTVTAITARPIPTRYAGCHFRSRLEARWAVFFNHLGVEWRYEPEGFDLDGQWYLPDFYLPSIDTWYEVKGQEPAPGEVAAAWKLEQATGQRVVVAWGNIPHDADCNGRDHQSEHGRRNIETSGDFDYAWCICPWCPAAGIEFDARSARIHGWKHHGLTEQQAWEAIKDKPNHHRIDDKCYSGDHPRILAAYEAARSARFEHGQSG
jgi:hypothetical protein